MTFKFEIKDRFSGKVLFEADLATKFKDQSLSAQMGAAIELAVKNGADLCDANLRGADLYGATLCDADLRDAKGVLRLPVSDLSYDWLAICHRTHWMIHAGCRWFTIEEARAHWLSPDYSRSKTVKETVGFALDWLEKQPLQEEMTK